MKIYRHDIPLFPYIFLTPPIGITLNTLKYRYLKTTVTVVLRYLYFKVFNEIPIGDKKRNKDFSKFLSEHENLSP